MPWLLVALVTELRGLTEDVCPQSCMGISVWIMGVACVHTCLSVLGEVKTDVCCLLLLT